MAATPKTGVIRFRGASGTEYQYSLYNTDVAAGFLTWATTAVAGSGNVAFITAPEDMVLEDISVVTGIVDTTALVLWLDDAPVRNTIIQWADVLNTIQSRSFPSLGIKAGRKVQLASA